MQDETHHPVNERAYLETKLLVINTIVFNKHTNPVADALYFHREKKLKEKWDNKEITPEKYWQKTATAYYVYKPVWWGLVISAMYFTKGDVKDKAKIGLMIVGAGAVVGIVYRNYTKDIQDVRREVLTSMEPKKNITGPTKPVKVGQYRSVLRKGNVLKFVA